MEFLSNIILAAAALGAAIYCYVLSRRLRALSSLEGGMGTAIAVLSKQVDDLSRSLRAAQGAAGKAGDKLTSQTARAEAAIDRIELMMASLHDLPSPTATSRDPSRWPAEPSPVPRAPQESAPTKARILRRRRETEAL